MGMIMNRGPGARPLSASYVYRGHDSSEGPGTALTSPIDIGDASDNRLVIAGLYHQNDAFATSITANDVPLSLVVQSTASLSYPCEIYAGFVTSGSGEQTIAADWSTAGSTERRGFFIWTLRDLQLTTVVSTAGGAIGTPSTLSVTAGDFMFGITAHATNLIAKFTGQGCTQEPTQERGAGNEKAKSADWRIVATNASFSVVAAGTWCVAVWR